MNDLINKVIAWAKERGIFEHSNSEKQMLKSASELGEICDAIAKEDWEAAKMEIGDFIVTMILLSQMAGIEFFINDVDKYRHINIFDLHYAFSSILGLEVNSQHLFKSEFNKVVIETSRLISFIGSTPEECLQLAYEMVKKGEV